MSQGCPSAARCIQRQWRVAEGMIGQRRERDRLGRAPVIEIQVLRRILRAQEVAELAVRRGQAFKSNGIALALARFLIVRTQRCCAMATASCVSTGSHNRSRVLVELIATHHAVGTASMVDELAAALVRIARIQLHQLPFRFGHSVHVAAVTKDAGHVFVGMSADQLFQIGTAI